MNIIDSSQTLIGQIPSTLSSFWLLLAAALSLMITTLMTFLRSLNNEGQEERYTDPRQGETDHWRVESLSRLLRESGIRIFKKKMYSLSQGVCLLITL